MASLYDESETRPLQLLVDELRSDDVQLRLNAVHRVSTIALALGPQRARDELTPFLTDSLDDEDEVLLALADEFGKNFEEYIGGKEYAHVLLLPLENLSAVEETLVRDKVRSHLPTVFIFQTRSQATESITKIAGILSPAQIEEFYLPLLRRLTRGEWFTSRTSAASLYAPVYDFVLDVHKEEMRKMFTALGSDDTPMVRRAAAKWLGVSYYLTSGSAECLIFLYLYFVTAIHKKAVQGARIIFCLAHIP